MQKFSCKAKTDCRIDSNDGSERDIYNEVAITIVRTNLPILYYSLDDKIMMQKMKQRIKISE